MPDQTLQILIESLKKGDGGKLTIEEQKQVAAQLEATAKAAEKSADRQVEAQKRISAEQRRTNEQANAAQKGQGVPPVVPPRARQTPQNPPSEEGGHSNANARRHWGAVAGQILNLPGAGMLLAAGGMTAGLGAAIMLIEKIVDKFNAWKEAIDETAAAWRKVETAGQFIDSMAIRQQKLNHHTEQFHLTLAQIQRQLHTTQAQVKLFQDEEETLSAFEARRDEARFARMRAEVELQQRLNPVSRIQQLEAIEEQAYQRRISREEHLEQVQLRSIELQQRLSEIRAAHYSREAEGVKAGLKPLEEAADKADYEKTAVEAATDKAFERIEKLRAVAQRMVEGRAAYGDYRDASNLVLSGEGAEEKAALDALIGDPTKNDALLTGMGFVPDNVKKAAQELIGKIGTGATDETGTVLSRFRDRRMVARAKANATRHALETHMRSLGFAEDEIQNATRDFTEAEMGRQATQGQINIKTPLRGEESDETLRSLQLQRDLNIRNSLPSVSIPPTGGGAAVDLNGLKEVMERVAAGQELLARIWSDNGGVA